MTEYTKRLPHMRQPVNSVEFFLNGTNINTLYEVLLTEWVDDCERKDSHDNGCIGNRIRVDTTFIRDIVIHNHVTQLHLEVE